MRRRDDGVERTAERNADGVAVDGGLIALGPLPEPRRIARAQQEHGQPLVEKALLADLLAVEEEREQRVRYREIDAAVDRFRMKLFEGIAAKKGATLKVKPSLKT